MSPYDAVPTALRECAQWVCWRTADRDGTETKLPVNPRTGRLASVADEATWTDFATAYEAVETESTLSGIGFVFTESDSFVGVDLDAMRDPETGQPDVDAKAIVGRLDSYTEVSPSGTGYHVILEGAVPAGGNRAGRVECYDHARFFTVTGEHVAGTPGEIVARQAALDAVHRDYINTSGQSDCSVIPDGMAAQSVSGDDAATPTAQSDTTHSLPDDVVLARAGKAKNAQKFARLWDGDTTGYDSHSEADMALACHLAFWTGRDTAQMDRLFRKSALYRAKWDDAHYSDGTTYGEATLQRAAQITTDAYTPARETTANEQNPGLATDVASLQRDVARLERTLERRTTEQETVADIERRVHTLTTQLEYLQSELETERAKRNRLATKLAIHERDTQPWWRRLRRT
ncbi:phage NrS-1 polymerase family protein [Halarchaeum sp. P4]|uniref:phage NrS-1 polymerase family protein n=1 Tax=Halarchaeum sp. P4 TaxID=3421639 RepID=UPI003EBA370D